MQVLEMSNVRNKENQGGIGCLGSVIIWVLVIAGVVCLASRII